MSEIKNAKYLQSIKNCGLFYGIDEKELAGVIKPLDGRIRKYKEGEFIITLGSELSRAGIVLDGAIESSFQNENFDNINMHDFTSGDLFAEALILNGVKESPVQVSAIKESIILFVDLNKIFEDEGNTSVKLKLAGNLARSLSKKNMIINKKIRILTQKTLREKILTYLSSSKKNEDGGYTIPLTQTALAEYLAVNRSALSREIGRMEDDGTIKYVIFRKIK